MELEWDETKRELNRRKHNLDFRLADLVFDGRPLYSYDSPHSYDSPRADEQRVVSIGMVEATMIATIWLEREGRVRIISIRRARRGEERAYRALHDR
jgi:uncharacterized protein